MNPKKRFDIIAKKIKDIKIQGAGNIAKSALQAYHLIPIKSSKKKLLSLRPTEPMMENVLELAEKGKYYKALKHFSEAQEKINSEVFKLIKNKDVIFTHCHSTNVINSLIYSRKKGKKFEVYNTETRPLFQGRKTAKQLKNAGIKITMFIDSAMDDAITESDIVFLGADALLRKGIINKIGSEAIAEISYLRKKPVYIIADSWKFTKSKVPLENRKLNEVWDKAPKNIKIKNPAFEFVPKKYISGIITELGLMKYDKFVGGING